MAPEDFGLIAISATFIGFISLLKDFGYSSYIIQTPHIDDAELVCINTRVVLLGIAAFIATCLLVIPMARFYDQEQLLWILPVTGALFILNAFTLVPQALMRKEMQFGKVGTIDVSSKLASLIAGMLLLLIIRNYWVLLFTSIIHAVFQIVMTQKLSKWHFRFSNPLHNKVSAAGAAFGQRLTIFNIMTFISVNLDTILIGKLAGNVVLGNYNKAFDFGCTNVDRLVRRPLLQVYFADLSGKSIEKKCELFYQYLYLLLSLLLLVVGPALICAPWLVDKFLSSRWQPLSFLLPPFLLCSFFWMSMSLADQLLVSTTKLRRYLLLGVAKAITGSLAIIIASFWGAAAIAWAFLIYHLVLFIPFCYSVFSAIHRENSKVHVMMAEVAVLVFSAALCAGIPYLLSHYNVITVQFAVAIFILLYILLHIVIWRKIAYYQSFRLFFRSLVRFKLAKVSV